MNTDTTDTIGLAHGAMAPPDSPTTLGGVARILFAHRSTRVVVLSAIPLLATRIVVGGWSLRDLAAAVGVALAWPMLEWVLHVAMHQPPRTLGRMRIDPELFRAHRRHHREPGVVDDLLLPWPFLTGLAVLAWTLMPALFGIGPGLTAAFVFHLGGLLNGWVHLLTHTRVRPRTRYYAWIRRTHARHHCQDHRRWFAFTGPWLGGFR